MTNILDVLKGLSLDDLEKQRTELIETVVRTEVEIATLAHVIVAVKELTPRKPKLSVTTAFKDAIEKIPSASGAYTFLAKNQPDTHPAVAEWPADLTPKEPVSGYSGDYPEATTLSTADQVQAALTGMPGDIRPLPEITIEPACKSFNTKMENLPSVEIAVCSKMRNRVRRPAREPVIEPAPEFLPAIPFDMENVSMERKVRTYLESAGAASAMAMASTFGLPNAKTLIRLLESDPVYERDSRGFWSIKK